MRKKTGRKTINKSSMKITINKRKRKAPASKSVAVKSVKFKRTLAKMVRVTKRSMKKSLKHVPTIRTSIYKKIDVAVSRTIQDHVEAIVTETVNSYLEKSTKSPAKTARKTTTRKTRRTRKSKETVAA